MSRIGKKPITIPNGVTVELVNTTVIVKGPKGTLSHTFSPEIKIERIEDTIVMTRSSDAKEIRSLHGLTRALVQNFVTGVSEGFVKTLDIVGVGYRVELKGNGILISIGYSHPIFFIPPEGITLQVPTQTQIVVSGIDKQLVGSVSAKIRSFRQPEPYKGKGIKYSNEIIRRKAGKTAGK